MIIKKSQANKKQAGPMMIREYKINSDFSGALIEIDGDHGRIKCLKEDRIYYRIGGKGEFELDGETKEAGEGDLVFVPQNTPYNIIGKLKYFLICSPEFRPEDDVFL